LDRNIVQFRLVNVNVNVNQKFLAWLQQRGYHEDHGSADKTLKQNNIGEGFFE